MNLSTSSNAPAALLRRLLLRCRRGSAAVELGIGLALLLPLFMAGTEMARFILLNQKVERVVMSVGDLNARADVLTLAETRAIFDAVPHLMQPFGMGGAGLVVVSGVTQTASGPVVSWQVSGAGSLAAASRVGAPGMAATLPGGLGLMAEETVVVTEIFYDYTPMLVSIIQDRRLYDRSVFRTRAADATRLQ